MSSLGSLRHRVPILDGEYFHEWKNEMLVIFNQYHLNKYIASPCAPHIDPLHPTPEEDCNAHDAAISPTCRGTTYRHNRIVVLSQEGSSSHNPM